MYKNIFRKGFTIVELVIVIAVIGILAAVLIPTFKNVIKSAEDNRLMQEGKNACLDYVLLNPLDENRLFIYEIENQFVTIKDGAPIYVYDTFDNAKESLVTYIELYNYKEVSENLYILYKDHSGIDYKYGDVYYIWSDNYSHLTAKHICLYDENHVEIETVDTNSTVIYDSTCQMNGLVRYTSNSFVNENFEIQTIDVTLEKLTHNYNEEIVLPTCTEMGYTKFICSCGDNYTDNYVPEIGSHNYGEWYMVSEATYLANGEECRECLRCSSFEFREYSLGIIDSGNFGYGNQPTDDIIYTLYDNGLLYVKGTGIIFGKDWNGSDQPFYEYRDMITEIVIGEGVTKTSGGCFAHLINLEKVTFPSTFTSIQSNGFMNSFHTSITSITLPKSITSIGAYALGHYNGKPSAKFTDIYIVNPNISISADNSINGGSNFNSLKLYSYGDSNKVSTYATRYGCFYVNIDNYLEGEVNNLKYEYFDGVLLLSSTYENVNIPVDNQPWQDYKDQINNIIINNGISNIPSNAFSNYPSLEEVSLHHNIESIGDFAFSLSTETDKTLKINIPLRVSSLGNDIFKGRNNVDLVTYRGSLAENINESGVNVKLKTQFKLLMIGNSYTEDASGIVTADSQLFNIMKIMLGEDADITLAILTNGGKGVNWHATQAENNTSLYSLRVLTNDTNKWINYGTVTSKYALEWTDWDAVSLQPYNLNTYTGSEAVAYPSQTDEKFYDFKYATEYMLDYINKYAKYADIYCYMHWLQSSSTTINASLSQFNNYANYFIDVLNYSGNETNKKFTSIIPVGLAIQNARTTYLAELEYNKTAYADGNLNPGTDAQIGLLRDGSHLSYNIGCYIAGLIFAEMIIPKVYRLDGYEIPDIRRTESIGILPKDYTDIAQKSVYSAIDSYENGNMDVKNIENYSINPIYIMKEQIENSNFYFVYGTSEELIEQINQKLTQILSNEFNVVSIELESDYSFKTKIRYGYTNVELNITYSLELDL